MRKIKKLDLAVEETSANIRAKQQNIEETKQQIVALKKEIEEVAARIEQRNELLKERARSLQESGGVVSYLDVLLGAKSFSDFIDRMSAVATIFEADRQIIKEQEADKALKEAKEQQLNDQLVSLQKQLTELQQLKQTLNEQIAAKEKLMAQLKEEQKHEEEKQLALEEEKELLEKQEAAMKSQLQEMIRRQKEQEEARKRALASRGSSEGDGAVCRLCQMGRSCAQQTVQLHRHLGRVGVNSITALTSVNAVLAFLSLRQLMDMCIAHIIHQAMETLFLLCIISMGKCTRPYMLIWKQDLLEKSKWLRRVK
ncbi:Peptidoglycan DL-endopeptidase CwlO precursor [Anoxybacillus sp. BCO1]|nr:Peptidoglycan DL-endopeptidase CwlO precursor [Anoxybacillus sp. BCO1]